MALGRSISFGGLANFLWRLPLRAAMLTAWLLSLSLKVAAIIPTAVPSAATEPAARGIGGGGIIQALLGLAFVIGLIFFCGWAAKRFGLRQSGSSAMLKLVSSVSLGQREKVVVVEVGETWLVLGVTPTQVNLLHRMDAQADEPALDGEPDEAARTPAPKTGMKLSDAFAQKLMETLNRQRPSGKGK
jgi:flagellar protein FliO/FliZ